MGRLGRVLVALVLSATVLTGAPADARAATMPAAPTGLTPSGGASAENPVLAWKAVPTSTRYDVQVSTTADFTSSIVFAQTTANLSSTPPSDLVTGSYFWRVRGIDFTGTPGPFAQATFTKTTRNAPVPITPGNGTNLVYPLQPLFYSWQPLVGAQTYELQVDDDALFVGAPDPVSTPNTVYTPLAPPVFNTAYYWRVRGRSAAGNYSQWSAPQSYTMAWDPTSPWTSPLSPPSTNAQTAEEVVFQWTPVAGAAYYELDLSPDENFNNPIINHQRVNASRFARPLNLPAGAYFWRIRAMSTSNVAEPGPWSPTWTFTRQWPGATYAPRPYASTSTTNAQVTLTYPADGAYSLTEPEFRWTAQRGASEYEIQVSTDSNFSPGNVQSCFTDHTRFTPPTTQCRLSYIRPGVVTYWRVRAQDHPSGPAVNGQWTPARSFLYDPGLVTLTGPANGAAVQAPVLTWNPLPDVSYYRITLEGLPGSTNCNGTSGSTYNTAWVPPNLSTSCVGGWRWTVQGVEDGSAPSGGGATRLAPVGSWRTFSWTQPNATATPTLSTSASSGFRPPLFSWTRADTATNYVVFVSVFGANSFSALNPGGTNQTAYAYEGNTGAWNSPMSPGDFQAFVVAYNGWTELSRSNIVSFHIDPMPVTQLTAPANCPLSSCSSVERDTPTFRWNPVDGAGFYVLYLATDPNFTNIIREYQTPFSSYTPLESLPDSQAGQATYWFVRPCVRTSWCGPFDATVFAQARAFRKVSVAVEPVWPVPGTTTPVDPTVAAGQPTGATGEINFQWKDYLATNVAAGVDQEAAYYRVQVSTTANFTNVIDTSPNLDQTEYTPTTLTYPDGPLYWRVQAFDDTNNPLTYSAPVSFQKKRQAPTGLASQAAAGGLPLFKWNAMPFAGSYQVEIYKNPDQALSPTNRVLTMTTRLTNTIPTSALPPGAYGWRVARLDPNGLPGAWSADVNTGLARFTMAAPAPVLTSPTTNQVISAGLVFRWNGVAGAARYRLDASTTSSFATNIQSVVVDTTAWAPDLLSPVWPNGQVFWRVSALSASNEILSTSTTGTFVRDASTAGELMSVSPSRAYDTRTNKVPLGAGETRTVSLSGGSTGIPTTGVSAVVANVTVTSPKSGSYLTLWPAGGTKPTVSTINFAAGQTVANHATLPVGWGGQVSVYNQLGTVDVIIDVVGYYSDGALPRATRFVGAPSPTRIVDTRTPKTPLFASESRLVEVAGLGGVPADASSVVVNVTAVKPTASGFFTVYPNGSTRPTTSVLNFPAGRTVPNLVTMPLGSGGDLRVFNSAGTTDLIVDVLGWYVQTDPPSGSRFNTLTPSRQVDTRNVNAPAISAGTTRAFVLAGKGGVPTTGVRAVVLNVTAVRPKAGGFLSVLPGPLPVGTTAPATSNVNFVAAQTVAAQVIVPLSADGRIYVYSSATTDALVDVVGWMG